MNLRIEDDYIILKTINKSCLDKVMLWYNDFNEYKYATGVDNPITINHLHQKIAEVVICDNEFFLAISLKSGQCIGVIKGGINTKFNDTLWIYSIIIDKKFQNMGYGTKVINLIDNYFKTENNINVSYISVVEINTKALRFWTKLGFVKQRKLKNHLVLENQIQDIIIMSKELNSKSQNVNNLG